MLIKFLIAYLFIKIIYSIQLYEHDSCDSGKGVCLQLNNCPSIKANLAKRIRNHTVCFHKDVMQVVCCPVTTPPTTEKPKPLTKSYLKCLEYSKSIYIRQEYYDFMKGRNSYVEEPKCLLKKAEGMIVGGTNADFGEFPHMAYISYIDGNGDAQLLCGGSLVSERYVLTAAHCTTYDETLYIRLGELDILDNSNTNRTIYKVINVITYPQYTTDKSYHDIALMKLNATVIFTPYIRPICLPEENDNDFWLALATGWGSGSYKADKLPHLQKVTLNKVKYSDCFEQYDYYYTKLPENVNDKIQVCAHAEGKDTCGGDSGGPLQIYSEYVTCSYTLTGITATGRFCGLTNVSSIYTRVSYYKQWIEDIIW